MKPVIKRACYHCKHDRHYGPCNLRMHRPTGDVFCNCEQWQDRPQRRRRHP